MQTQGKQKTHSLWRMQTQMHDSQQTHADSRQAEDTHSLWIMQMQMQMQMQDSQEIHADSRQAENTHCLWRFRCRCRTVTKLMQT
jgi:hypothetical protein